jgi:glycosyltransferase involved in cell wall biosynthesis
LKKKVSIFTWGIEAGAFCNVTSNLSKIFSYLNYEKIDIVYIKGNHSSEKKFHSSTTFTNLNTTRALMSFLPLMRYLKVENPDVLISMPSHMNIVAIVAKFLARWKGKLIVTEHATMSYKAYIEHKNEFILRNMPFLAKTLYPYANGVCCVSEGVKEDLKNVIGVKNKHLVHIHNSLDINLVQTKANSIGTKEPWLEEQTIPCIVSIGRLAEQKDYTNLIKAFSLINKSDIRARCIIIGDGDKKEELTALINNLGLQSSVKLLGYVENPFPLLKKAKCFISSSIEEGFGLVIVEALALGVPVISTDAKGGGPREILTNSNAGVLVTSSNSVLLAEAVLEFLNNKSLSKSLTENTVSHAQTFSPESISKKWGHYLESL